MQLTGTLPGDSLRLYRIRQGTKAGAECESGAEGSSGRTAEQQVSGKLRKGGDCGILRTGRRGSPDSVMARNIFRAPVKERKKAVCIRNTAGEGP